MKDFEVLCATMNQADFSLAKKMNIMSNAIYANQCDETYYKREKLGDYDVEMISTATRGLGKNRNILLTYADCDICLFADDDVVYYPGYKDIIMHAFERHPDADMIIFNLDADTTERANVQITRERKMNWWERNPYGSVRIAFRLNSQRKFNIWFSNLLGAGALYLSGEDSLFINQFRKHGTVYLCNKTIGKVDFSSSTWFEGFTKEFFVHKGAVVAALYGGMKWIWFMYYARTYSKNCKISFWDRIALMGKGYSEYGKHREKSRF